jgi:hypothetical protein
MQPPAILEGFKAASSSSLRAYLPICHDLPVVQILMMLPVGSGGFGRVTLRQYVLSGRNELLVIGSDQPGHDKGCMTAMPSLPWLSA